METNLLDRMLNTYLTEQTTVAVTLQNRIRVAGKIKAFDSYVIVMDSPKREILYRHAISSLTPMVQEEQKRQPESPRPRPATAKPAPGSVRPPKSSGQKPRTEHRQPMLSASGPEPINSSMKEGLLKWMQDQKAAK